MPRICLSLLAFCLCFFYTIATSAQSPNIRWEQRYEANKAEQIFRSAIQDVEGDIVVAGESSAMNTKNGRQALLMVIDTGGTMIMPRHYGGEEDDAALSIVQGPDQTYFLGGYQGEKGWIWQIDREGSIRWEIILPDTLGKTAVHTLSWDRVGQLLYWAGEAGGRGVFGVISGEGRQRWQKVINHDEGLRLKKIVQDPKGRLFLLGLNPKARRKNHFAWLQSYTPQGQERWPAAREYRDLEPADLIFDPKSQSLWMTGTDWKAARGNMFLLELDREGKQKGPKKTYGGSMEDGANAFVQTLEGHFYTIGLGLSDLRRGAKYPRIWLNQLDTTGSEVWANTAYFGQDKENLGSDIIQLRNGDLLAVGASIDRGNRHDGWLLCLEGSPIPDAYTLPELNISDFHLQGGNGDDFIDAGEEVFLHAKIKNTGRTVALGLQGRLDPEVENAAIQLKSIKTLGGMRSGEEREIVFRVKAREDLKDGPARLHLSIQTKNGRVITSRTLETQTRRRLRTELTLMGSRLYPKEKIKPGEAYALEIYVRNTGETPVEKARLSIVLPKGVTTEDPPEQTLETLPPGIPGPIYINFTVDRDFREAALDIKLYVEDSLFSFLIQEVISLEVALPAVTPSPSVPDYLVWSSHHRDSIHLLEKKVAIHLMAISGKPILLEEDNFTIWINGKALRDQEGQKYRKVPLVKKQDKQNQEVYHLETVIPLSEGWNEVRVEYHKNGERSVSPSRFFYSGDKPKLFVLAIGVPFENLKYTTKDAREFADALRSQEGLLYHKVETMVLDDEKQTRCQPLRLAMASLLKRWKQGEITERDMIIVYISSHGQTITRRDGNREFRIIPSDVDNGLLGNTTLDFEDDIIRILQDIPCKKKVFVDACQAEDLYAYNAKRGARSGTGQELEEVVFKLAEPRESLQYLLSCRPGERSFEDDTWENGAFTEALLEAFSNKIVEIDGQTRQADEDGDEYLSMSEIHEFVSRRVPQLVKTVKKAIQHPVMKSSNPDQQVRFFRLKPKE